MSISVRDRKLLWSNSGNRCAICNTELIDKYNNIIGEEAHIISSKPNGPRGDTSIAQSEIDSYENLILLCPTHHAEIDKNVDYWTVEKLKETKKIHEEKVKIGLDNTNIRHNMFEKEDLEKLKYFLDSFNNLFIYIIDSVSEIAHMMPSDVHIELDYISQISYYNRFKAYSRKINQYQDIIHKNCIDLYNETMGKYRYEGTDYGIVFDFDKNTNVYIMDVKNKIEPYLKNIIEAYFKLKEMLEY